MLNRTRNSIRALVSKIEDRLARKTCDYLDLQNHLSTSIHQKLLELSYREMVRQAIPLPGINEVGWKRYSQTDEDGIIHFIFSVIGATNKKCIEICASDGKECNSANLLINRQWYGLLVDGNIANVESGKKWFEQHRATYVYPPKFEHAWVTKDNVNHILEKAGFTGDIDLLSIDLDGVDYWIWDAIKVATPRVIVIEYQQHLGPTRAVTVPYADDFNAWRHPTSAGWLPNYAGASLAALAKLGKKKGYRLVGCNHLCFNAFFVRDGIADHEIPETPVAGCFTHERAAWSMKNRWPTVQNMPWVEV